MTRAEIDKANNQFRKERIEEERELRAELHDELDTLRAENAQLIEDKKNLNITIENAAEWSEKQADEIEKLSEALQRCKKWFFQHAPTAVLPDGTGQEAHREITDVLFRAEIPA